MQQNQQSMNANLSNNVLYRAKPEILRVVEMLITKMNAEVIDLLVEVIFITNVFIFTVLMTLYCEYLQKNCSKNQTQISLFIFILT